MSNENNKTITDIVAEKRREAEYIIESAKASAKAGETMSGTPYGEGELELAYNDARTIQAEADRLEAALKREVATAKISLAVGNTAKLREVLKEVKRYLDGCTVNILELRRKVDAALAEPPRNCDLYADERSAWEAFSEKRQGPDSSTEEYEQWLFEKATA